MSKIHSYREEGGGSLFMLGTMNGILPATLP